MANQHPEWVIKASLEVDKLLQDIETEKTQASQQKEDRIKSLLSAVELSRKLKADVLAAKKSLKDDELKTLKEKEERAKRLKAEIEKRRNAKAIQAEIDKVKKAMTPEELKIMEAARLEIKNKQKIIEKLSQLKAAIKAKRFEAEELRKRLEAAPKLSEKEAKKVKEEKIVEETTRFQKTTKRPEEVVDPETAKPIEEVEKKLFEEVVATINKLTEITNAKQAEMKKITDAFKDPEASQSKAVEQAIENYYNHAKVNNKLGDLAKLTEERFIGVYERLKPKSKKYTKEEQEKIDKVAAEIKALQEKKKELEELLGKYTEFTREITVLELEKKPKQTQIKTSINAEEQAEIIEDAEAMEKGTGVLEQIVNVLKDMLRIGNNIEKMVPVAASTNKVNEELDLINVELEDGTIIETTASELEEIEASIKAEKIMYRKEDGEEVLVREDKEGRFQVYDRREGVWRSANEEDFVEDESLVEEDFLKDDELEKKLKKLKKLKRN